MTGPDEEGWQLVELKEVTQDVANVNPSLSPDTSFTYIDISSIDSKTFSVVDPKHVLGSQAPSRARRPVEIGDVLFSNVRTYLRNVAQVEAVSVPAIASTGFTLLRAEEGTSQRYLFHLARSRYFMSLATPEQAGSHYPATSDSKVRGLEVPMPSYARQVSTAPLLDRVEETRRHVLTLLDNANESASEALKSATNQACIGQLTVNWRSQRPDASNADIHLDMDARSLTSSLGSPVGEEATIAPDYLWATLEDLALSIDYGTSLRASTEMSDIEVMRMGNIQDGEIVRDDLRYLPSGSVPPSLLLEPGDLLFDRTNGSPDLVGKTAVFRGGPAATFASYLIRIRLNTELVHPDWVATWINSSWGRTWALNVRSVGVSQSNISGSKLKALRLPVPDYEEQIEIISQLQRIKSTTRELQALVTETRATIAELADSVLDQAVAGPYFREQPSATDVEESGGRFEVVTLALPWTNVSDGGRTAVSAGKADVTTELRTVVSAAGGRIEAGALWQASDFARDIDGFYVQLRHEIDNLRYLREDRSDDAVCIIELVR